jgi:hypothetical protein
MKSDLAACGLENQPPVASIEEGQLEHVLKECSKLVRLRTEEHRMNPNGHAAEFSRWT